MADHVVPGPLYTADESVTQLDFTHRYNTQLSPQEQRQFIDFIDKQYSETGRDYTRDMTDYDVMGWWKDTGGKVDERGHGVDTYKKPNHPTFSDESKYHGKDGYRGGSWIDTQGGTVFLPSREMLHSTHSIDRLHSYMQKYEPGFGLMTHADLPVPKIMQQSVTGEDTYPYDASNF